MLGQAIVSLAMDDNTRAQAGELPRLRASSLITWLLCVPGMSTGFLSSC
jgi:hypothetical protein